MNYKEVIFKYVACVFVCMCVFTHCVCVYTCGSQRLILGILFIILHLLIWNRNSQWTWSLPFQLDWLANETQNCQFLSCQRRGYRQALLWLHFPWVLGIRTRVLVLAQQTPYLLGHLSHVGCFLKRETAFGQGKWGLPPPRTLTHNIPFGSKRKWVGAKVDINRQTDKLRCVSWEGTVPSSS